MKDLDNENEGGDAPSDEEVSTPAEPGTGWGDEDLNLPSDFVLDPSMLKADISSEGKSRVYVCLTVSCICILRYVHPTQPWDQSDRGLAQQLTA